jgi:hypothetical protein
MLAYLAQTFGQKKDKEKTKEYFFLFYGTEGYRFESCGVYSELIDI